MKDPKRFYTYAYLREDGTPYYIGKGEGNRAYKKRKGEIRPPKDKSRIIFLKKNLLEEEAFSHEEYMIAVFGRKDLGTGILRNRTNGGEGSSGVVISKEKRRKLSEMWRGENNPNYGKTKEKNPDYGKKWWNDGNGNTKKSFECPGEGWTLGMGEQHKIKVSEKLKEENNPNYNKKWWNDGNGNTKFCVECPGLNWFPGMSEETKIRKSRALKGKPKSKKHREKISKSIKDGKNNKGKKWWNDGNGNTKFAVECPGEGWVLGRKILKIS